MSTFSALGLAPDLVDALAAGGITSPFPVQAATIPDALAGLDVCGRAPTGSGKTIAFGAPLVERVEKARPRRPSALILAPTRELAAQIARELEPMAVARNHRVFTIYGGVGYEPQKRALWLLKEASERRFWPSKITRIPSSLHVQSMYLPADW